MELQDSVREAIRGNTDAFEIVVKTCESRLRAYCTARLPGDEVEDAMQDIFLKAFRLIASYNESYPFPAWLFTIARTHIATRKLKFWRERQKRERATRFYEDIPDRNGGQEALEAEMARNLVASLGKGQREVIELHYYAGLSVKEISLTLSLGESAVKQRFARARKEMMQTLEGNGRKSGEVRNDL